MFPAENLLVEARMNYLAHAYLSFGHDSVQVGNIISDFVKGREKEAYPPDIRKGIQLHRDIDTFTDMHPATAQVREKLREAAGRYSAPFADIIYDHFLALDETELDSSQWKKFAVTTYRNLRAHLAHLPANFAMMLPHMERQDWLYNYRFVRGMENSFAGLVRRAKYITDHRPAFEAFEKQYDQLHDCYRQFFPALKAFAEVRFKELMAAA